MIEIAAIVISIVSAVIAWKAEKRVSVIYGREEYRYKINVLARCMSTAPEVECEALNEVYSAFYNSRKVVVALQRFHVALEVRGLTRILGERKTGCDILAVIKQGELNAVKRELIKAMCMDVGVSYGLISNATGFTEKSLARYKPTFGRRL